MEIRNKQFKSTLVVLSLFVVIVLTINFFAAAPVPYFFVISIGTTHALFRLFSGDKAKVLIIEQETITVEKYARPFKLEEKSYDLKDVKFRRSKEFVSEATTASKIYAEDLNGQRLFVISTELMLWEKSDLEKIINFIGTIRPLSVV